MRFRYGADWTTQDCGCQRGVYDNLPEDVEGRVSWVLYAGCESHARVFAEAKPEVDALPESYQSLRRHMSEGRLFVSDTLLRKWGGPC